MCLFEQRGPLRPIPLAQIAQPLKPNLFVSSFAIQYDTEDVSRTAFRQDGRQIVSGSWDTTEARVERV
jgi:hypothetical protein